MTVDQDGFIVNTVGCRIPNLNPFDDSIQEFIFNEQPVICDAKHRLPLVESNLNSLYVNRAAFESYKITDRVNFGCFYTAFFRDESTPNVTFRWLYFLLNSMSHNLLNFQLLVIKHTLKMSLYYCFYVIIYSKNINNNIIYIFLFFGNYVKNLNKYFNFRFWNKFLNYILICLLFFILQNMKE